jgi:hypothetical protein
MKLKLLSAVAALFSASALPRAMTCDVSYQYRMPGGMPGDVNRFHPASIVAGLIDSANPARRYGDPVVFGAANNYRCFNAGDTALTKINGVIARPYPIQQQSTTNYGAAALGAAVPPTSGIADYLESGFIMTQVPTGQTPKKGDAVFVWCAANSGSHVQGGFENAASAGNTAAIANAVFWGPPDSAGNVEIRLSAF